MTIAELVIAEIGTQDLYLQKTTYMVVTITIAVKFIETWTKEELELEEVTKVNMTTKNMNKQEMVTENICT